MQIEIVSCPTWENNKAKAASLVALIKERHGITAVITPGRTGQFDVLADGKKIVERGGNWLTRKFGAGYPDLNEVVELLEKRGSAAAAADPARSLLPS